MKKVLTKLLCLTMAVGMSVSILASCGGGEDPASGNEGYFLEPAVFGDGDARMVAEVHELIQ